MPTIDAMAVEAINLADGSDIHDISGMVAIYRSLTAEGCDVSALERELRRYIVRKRIERSALCQETSGRVDRRGRATLGSQGAAAARRRRPLSK